MGCGDRRRQIVTTIGVVKGKNKATPPTSSDFHCVECGLTRLRRPVGYTHYCVPNAESSNLDYRQERLAICNECKHQDGDICKKQKQLYPDRDCSIAVGIKKPESHCPLRKWSRRSRKCPKCSANIHSLGVPWRCHACDWIDETIVRGKALVTMVVGSQAKELAKYTLPKMRAYAKRCGAEVLVIEINTGGEYVLASKFQVESIAKRYLQTLFVDIDVIIRDDCPDLFAMYPHGVAMHSEAAKLHHIDWYIANLRDVCQSQNLPLTPVDCWNTGVVLCDRETAGIWTAPAAPLPRYHTSEQTWVAVNAKRQSIAIQPLSSNLNWQAWYDEFAGGLSDAKIVHLASMPHAERIAFCQWA